MSAPDRFKPYASDIQAVVRLDEALPPEHPVHLFVDLVQTVDLSHFVIPPGPKGEKPYHPHALVGILAWGYLHGVRSARKLARLARQEATFVYLAGGGRPNYRTLARFRRDNAAAFTAVFQETVVLALRLGLARLGHVALDGTKLKANTSKHKAMSYGRMRQREAQLKEEIARLMELAESQDAAEDQEYGTDSDGYSVAEELARREARLAKIQAAREHLEAEQRADQGLPTGEPPVIADKEQRSFADTDARIMLMKRGAYDYADNAQAAVDAEHGVIVAATLTNVAPDMGHLPDLVADVRGLRDVAGLAQPHLTTVSADTGYFSGEHAAEDQDGLDLLIAAGRDDPAAATTKATVYSVDRFGYDPTHDVWIGPADKLLPLVPPTGRPGRVSKHQSLAASADCVDCPLRAHCLKPDEDQRLLQAKDRRSTGAMRFKLRQPDARRRYARRKAIVEPVFGHLKEARGFTTLSLRGLAHAAGEYLLACLAHNLGKLLRVCPLPSARLAPEAACASSPLLTAPIRSSTTATDCRSRPSRLPDLVMPPSTILRGLRPRHHVRWTRDPHS